MLKTVLIVLAISWSQTEVKAQHSITFDPPALKFGDKEVTITSTYDLSASGTTAKQIKHNDPAGSIMLSWTKDSGFQPISASFDQRVSKFDKVDDIDRTHSLTLRGDWCTLRGTYETVVTSETDESVRPLGTLAADNSPEAIEVYVDSMLLNLNENIEVSTLIGKVNCVGKWPKDNLSIKLREGDNPDTDGEVGDSTPAPCTKKGVAEVNFNFTGAENQPKTFTCTVNYEGQEAIFAGTVIYNPNLEEPTTTAKAIDGNGNGGDGTGDGNKDGDGPGDGNNEGGNDDKEDGKEDPLNKLFDKLQENNGACAIHTEVSMIILLLSAFWMLQKMF